MVDDDPFVCWGQEAAGFVCWQRMNDSTALTNESVLIHVPSGTILLINDVMASSKSSIAYYNTKHQIDAILSLLPGGGGGGGGGGVWNVHVMCVPTKSAALTLGLIITLRVQ